MLPHYSVDNTGIPCFTDRKSVTLHTHGRAILKAGSRPQPYSLLLSTLVASEQSSAEFLHCANRHKQEQTKGTSARQVQLLMSHPPPFSCSRGLCSGTDTAGQAISFLNQANTTTIFSDLFYGAENPKTTMPSQSSWSATLVIHSHQPSPGLPTYGTLPLDLCPQPSLSITNSCWLPAILHVLTSQEGRKRNTGDLNKWNGIDGQPGLWPLGPALLTRYQAKTCSQQLPTMPVIQP